MALSYDCYLRTGILYQYEDVPNEKYFIDVDDGTLTYSDLRKKPAFPGDLILLVSGPDKGRTGTVLGEISLLDISFFFVVRDPVVICS